MFASVPRKLFSAQLVKKFRPHWETCRLCLLFSPMLMIKLSDMQTGMYDEFVYSWCVFTLFPWSRQHVPNKQKINLLCFYCALHRGVSLFSRYFQHYLHRIVLLLAAVKSTTWFSCDLLGKCLLVFKSIQNVSFFFRIGWLTNCAYWPFTVNIANFSYACLSRNLVGKSIHRIIFL